MNHLAQLPDDLPLRLGTPLTAAARAQITPAPVFMVEALARLPDEANGMPLYTGGTPSPVWGKVGGPFVYVGPCSVGKTRELHLKPAVQEPGMHRYTVRLDKPGALKRTPLPVMPFFKDIHRDDEPFPSLAQKRTSSFPSIRTFTVSTPGEPPQSTVKATFEADKRTVVSRLTAVFYAHGKEAAQSILKVIGGVSKTAFLDPIKYEAVIHWCDEMLKRTPNLERGHYEVIGAPNEEKRIVFIGIED